MDTANRKLIRPSLNELKDQMNKPRNHQQQKKANPPDQTNAENFYYMKQMQGKTPMVIVMKDGEEVQGFIEWYDRNCIKVNRGSASALLIYKPSIRYIYKAGEGKP